jgi:quinol monooxygenase YgiN
MHYLNIWLSVNDPAHTAQVAELLTEAGRLSRAEPGCLRFEVYHSTSDPARFLLCERWESDVALAAHRQ